MVESNFFIPRIPLDDAGLCAHATIESAASAFGIVHIHQKDLHPHVSNPEWGTEPSELVKMSKAFLPDSNIFAREHWDLTETKKLLSSARVVMVLDVIDCLERVDKVLGKKVEGVDGHYIILAKIVEIQEKPYALIIDPSKDEIVVEGNYGVINTNQENVYFMPFDVLEKIWIDDKKDGSLNDHWALVMLHPDDDPAILDQFRK
ncbi:MAG: hypothetical protein NTZ07_03165 [Candidatus Woesebacteria bacterium]|nr:hypothetical protein [Candidatus Woesebacteria bacterium]